MDNLDDADNVNNIMRKHFLSSPLFVTLRALLTIHYNRQSQRHSSPMMPTQLEQNEYNMYYNDNFHHNDTMNGNNQNATNTKNTMDCCNSNNDIGIVIGNNNSTNKQILNDTNTRNYYNDNNDNDDDNEDIDDANVMDQNNTNLKPRIPNTLDLTNRVTPPRRKINENLKFKSIIEECEYDSDVGKFNCKPSETSSLSSSAGGGGDYNNLDLPKSPSIYSIENSDNLNIPQYSSKIIDKDIEFDHTDKILNVATGTGTYHKWTRSSDDSNLMSSVLLMGVFLSTLFLLYLFPNNY